MNTLIIPDKYRGTLTAHEAAQAIKEGLGGPCIIRAMADGGEGTAAALPGYDVVESARVIGHGSREAEKAFRERTSYDLGIAIREALARHSGDKPVIVAVGGTATCDGGAGMLQALGAKFYDREGYIIHEAISPVLLGKIHGAGLPDAVTKSKGLLMLADVEASLVPAGAGLSAVDFMAQKGADQYDIERTTAGLAQLHRVLGGHSAFDGAGGGVGYALGAVLQCEARFGAEYILEHLDVDWSSIDKVITGEGSIDRQSMGGKVVGTVLRFCRRRGIEVYALGGRVSAEISDAACIQASPAGVGLPTAGEAYRYLRGCAAKLRHRQ